MTDDRLLVKAVMEREPGAFERLVTEYSGLCWHIVFRMVRNPEDARDLCQETFLKVYRNLSQFRYESALKSWVGQIAYTVALRHLQRKRLPMVESVDTDEPSPVEGVPDEFDLEAACADEEVAARLHAAIDELPTLPRTILTLYHLEEMSIPEIVEVTGLASGTIKSHLFRARLKLRAVLEAQRVTHA